MNNTITIDGVTIELTKEQVEKLKVELGVKKKSPFERVEGGYYLIGDFGSIETTIDANITNDNFRYNIANYCTDKDLLTKRAKEEVLNRLLWRFSMENDGEKIDWSNEIQTKYSIYYSHKKKLYEIGVNGYCEDLGKPYFYSQRIAQRAIDEIIIPFNEGELPCCEICGRSEGMTAEEAIKHLKLIVDNEAYADYFQDVCRMAIEALEKQRPKKVKFAGDDSLPCPCCGYELMGSLDQPDHDPYYCFECGQALDWNGVSEV